MKAHELREQFIKFFLEKGHKEIPSASLIPENDSTTLFISAGMHPLVPYLLGEPHPSGKRLCDVQKCLRTGDIDSVGDTYHHTFFEMLGNWSLGDYWKDEMIPWSFEFLTKVLNIPVEKLSVTCFAGDSDAPKDEESASLWKKAGIPESRIYFLPKSDNWWGPAGQTGPCGPDSEMFFDTGKEKCGDDCKPGCNCGKYIEIWNDVFMQYNKTAEGKYVPLEQKNIDTGMGVERTTRVLSGIDDDYKTELFLPIIKKIEDLSRKSYEDEENKKPMRVFTDHSRAAIFLVAAGVVPGNKEREYVLRRLIRRADDQLGLLGVEGNQLWEESINFNCQFYSSLYNELNDLEKIKEVILAELTNYRRTITRAATVMAKAFIVKNITGVEAFQLHSTYGLSKEQIKEKGYLFSDEEFEKENKKHQELSRTTSAGMFKAGLADHSEIATKYHTATHLLHAALRQVLGDHVHQIGSNITSERLRFDFTQPEKLAEEQLKKVEDLINEKIKENLPVKMEVMTLEEAKSSGALAFFEQKYGEQVKVYSIGSFSKEVCGGPHVNSTGEIGKIKIIKEETSGAGKRRIYAKLL